MSDRLLRTEGQLVGRRRFLGIASLLAIAPLLPACKEAVNGTESVLYDRRIYNAIHPYIQWHPRHFDEFLLALDEQSLTSLIVALDLDASPGPSLSKEDRIEWLKDEIKYKSEGFWEYIFSGFDLDYDQLIRTVGQRLGVVEGFSDRSSTLLVERRILENLFVRVWDELDEDERLELLSRDDISTEGLDRMAIVSMSGAAALAALNLTVSFAGFAFYTTMSSVLAFSAGAIGLTLPMAVYTGASSTVAVLAGPVGWALVGGGMIYGAGRLTAQRRAIQMVPFIVQMHVIKVRTLQQAGQLDDVFRRLRV
jgi:uncharacterized protein YaaW (UPF0174 family)